MNRGLKGLGLSHLQVPIARAVRLQTLMKTTVRPLHLGGKTEALASALVDRQT